MGVGEKAKKILNNMWGGIRDEYQELGEDFKIVVEEADKVVNEVLNEDNLEKIGKKLGETIDYIEQKVEDVIEPRKKNVMESLKAFFIAAGHLFKAVAQSPEEVPPAFDKAKKELELAANDLYDAIGRAIEEKQKGVTSWMKKQNIGLKREPGLLSQPIKQGTKKPAAKVIEEAKKIKPETPKDKTAQDVAVSSRFQKTKNKKSGVFKG